MKKYAVLALCALAALAGPMAARADGPDLEAVRQAAGDETAEIVSYTTDDGAGAATRRLLGLPPPPPCQESDWSNWGNCVLEKGKDCGSGTQEARRTVKVGLFCVLTKRFTPCQGPPCVCPPRCENPLGWIAGPQTGVTIGSTASFTRGDCLLGYVSTTTMSVCGPDRKWCDIPEPKCTPRPCIDRIWDANADVTNNGMGCYGDTVKITCKPGYALVQGAQSLTCGKRGAWTSGLGCAYPKCVKTDCWQFRNPPENGYLTYSESPVQTFTVKCFTGYRLSCEEGRNVYTCEKGACHPPTAMPTCMPDPQTPARRLLGAIRADLE